MRSTFKPQHQLLLVINLVLASFSCTLLRTLSCTIPNTNPYLVCMFCLHFLDLSPLASLALVYFSFHLQLLILYQHISCTLNLLWTNQMPWDVPCTFYSYDSYVQCTFVLQLCGIWCHKFVWCCLVFCLTPLSCNFESNFFPSLSCTLLCSSVLEWAELLCCLWRIIGWKTQSVRWPLRWQNAKSTVIVYNCGAKMLTLYSVRLLLIWENYPIRTAQPMLTSVSIKSFARQLSA